MYLFKNSLRNLNRNKGKNIIMGLIVLVITLCTCIALSINKAGEALVNTYKKSNPLEVSFSLDMSNLRNATDEEKNNFQSLTVDSVKDYADSDLVKDYYYTLESAVNSTSLTAIVDNERPTNEGEDAPEMSERGEKFGNQGDFRITAYSNFAYLAEFEDGTKKITEGSMVSGSNEEKEIVISEDLADENDINVGDSVTFSLPTDEESTFTYIVVGIYEDNSESSASSFMNMNVLNSANQIYTNLSNVEEILDAVGVDDSKLVATNGLTAKYYLNSNDDVDKFYKEALSKGLDSNYTVTTNEEEILATLKPIQNISSFSMNFLIVIIVIGVVVLMAINFLNIRDRKYEIGVLRAIGMSKTKVTLELILEIFFVSLTALVIGTASGAILSQPITNKMLENEINSYTEQSENVEKNFGGEGFGKPSQGMGGMPNVRGKGQQAVLNADDYVGTLKVSLDAITIIKLFGVIIILTVTSGVVASLFVNKYSPNKILQNRV